MPLNMDVRKRLSASSERVKSVDLHATEPWALAALYSGNVMIWDYETATCIKSFELSDLPVRCAKFICRKQWFVAASDDMALRVYNYNTTEKVREFEAHADYIRYLEVHPTLPYVLSGSDDMSVKLWDWDQGWANTQYFEGHSHYVMMVRFNPKDTNTFATASLDRSIKVWGLGSPVYHYSLEGHERGVNCIDYYPSGDKPYLLSGADDRTVKVWDYQTKSVVHTLEGHEHNVCSVLFHPKLPLIASASEDGTVRIWQSATYRMESTLNYGMERAWALAATAEANKLAIGFDEGCVVVELGSDEAVASMDAGGRVVWAKNNDIRTASVRGVASEGEGLPDGEKLPLLPRDLGTCELYPQAIIHNCNGRFVAVCGDGEFIIYTAQALRNKAFGSALDFVWSGTGTGDYAIRESIRSVKIFKNFTEHTVVRPAVASTERIFGGALLGAKGSEAVLFYDFASGEFIRKIDVCPVEIYWSDAGDMVLLACTESGYVLSYNAAATTQALATGQVDSEDGVEGSFELLYEVSDKITSGKWVGDCFIYCNDKGRLNYSVGGQIQTLVHLDTTSAGATIHKIVGYLAKEDRIYLVDKSVNIVSYKIMLAMLQYQTAVMRGDFDTANDLLPSIPDSEYVTVAKFLEAQGFKEEALAVTTDLDHKFDLAVELGQIDLAHGLMDEIPKEDRDTTDTHAKWKRLGDAALRTNNFALCEAASVASNDYSGLLLLYSAIGNVDGMERLADMAAKGGKTNIAFVASLLTGKVENCVDLLVETKRLPEAAFFSRTFLPSKVDDAVSLWKEDLCKTSEQAAKALAAPSSNPDLFPDFDIALQVEQMFMAQRAAVAPTGIPAADYLTAKDDLDLELIELIKMQMVGAAVEEEKVAELSAEHSAEPPSEAPTDPATAPESSPTADSTTKPTTQLTFGETGTVDPAVDPIAGNVSESTEGSMVKITHSMATVSVEDEVKEDEPLIEKAVEPVVEESAPVEEVKNDDEFSDDWD